MDLGKRNIQVLRPQTSGKNTQNIEKEISVFWKMNFEWKGLTGHHLKAFLEMKLHISERTEGPCAQPMCTGRSLCGGLCACSCILCPEVMDCFYPYPVGRSGHLALTHYREAEKYSVVRAERGRKPRTG